MSTNYKGDYFTFQLIQNILCFASGLINALCIFDMGMTVSHQSGNTSHTGRLIMIPGFAQLLINCEVRFVWSYVSWPASSSFSSSFSSSSSSARPQLRALDCNVSRRTSSANSGSMCSPPDLNHELRMSVPRRTSTTKNPRRYTR